MLILDTDHISEIERNTKLGVQLVAKLDQAGNPIAITIVSVDEQMRGLLKLVRRARQPDERVRAYGRLQSYVEDLTAWTIRPWVDSAEHELARLQAARLGVSTMDLRIASITLANNATLLSRNLRDFQRIPNLSVENRLE